MTVEQGISFGITIGLGGISIILAILAIWLSLKFARDSEKYARDSEKSLALLQEKATEIRTLTEHIFSQQDKHITKLVDHALRSAEEGMLSKKYVNKEGFNHGRGNETKQKNGE
uniref:Uncharacterized protein n=1 Tax=Candidatus Kentrum sp. FM TaxID=2126340 RepID=A0A450T6M8_9GAMM|nr:MAG: hypothetical protein BECKFM1743C_GA0114222_103003 [Candidatus Kentron sp. FM]VFJ62409.1 MAG: hypothetical protein BECKFM1743A_GA0114220_103063 [Candidatus Kentron sp. FM]VFK13757.1 MAG: hypothetical protein BECKFM1743B_GA0114221_102933 [Candidatus Kentron sp. FM]